MKLRKLKQLLSTIKHINYISFKHGLTIGSKEYSMFEYINIFNGRVNYVLIDYGSET